MLDIEVLTLSPASQTRVMLVSSAIVGYGRWTKKASTDARLAAPIAFQTPSLNRLVYRMVSIPSKGHFLTIFRAATAVNLIVV